MALYRYVVDPQTGLLIQQPVYGSHLRRAYDNGPPSITTSETFQDKLALDVGVLAPGRIYELLVSYMWNHDATNTDFEGRVVDIGGNALIFSDGYHKQEPQDSAGNWEGTGSSQRFRAVQTYEIIGAGVPQLYTLQYRTDDADDASAIWAARMKFIRVA